MNKGSHAGARTEGEASILIPKSGAHQVVWRVWLAPAVLIIVALCQVVLAKTTLLSPWKGGGFGMFATTDGTASRYIRVLVEGPSRSEELAIAPSQEFAASRAQLFPSDRRMSALARAVVERERRYSREVHTVTLELWRTEYAPVSVDATDRRLRRFQWQMEDDGDTSEGKSRAQ